jgi:S1-C subfamily serine protease
LRLAGLFLAAASPFLNRPAVADDAPAADDDHSVATAAEDPVNASVVKIFATVRAPDLGAPWAKRSPQDVVGSGVVIEGKRILTCARVVSYATEVQIQGVQGGDKILGTVESIARGCDLAIIKLDDETFFNTHPPLERSEGLPRVRDSVNVYGFPTGGTTLSITRGIVSRIEFVQYFLRRTGVRVQIDAAINPGNSGGPAVEGNRMIGLAFNRLGRGTQEIGYIIPNEEIDIFMHGLKRGKVDDKPGLYDEWQDLQNADLRSYLRLSPAVHGILVRVPFDSAPSYPLKVGDVITKIGDTPIDDEGMIAIPGDLRISFLYRIQQIQKDRQVGLTVIRNGREGRISVPLITAVPRLLPYLTGQYPSYFIYGPLVFEGATDEYAAEAERSIRTGSNFAEKGNPLVIRRGDRPAYPGEELVVIPCPYFSDKITQGYVNHVGWVVKDINGIQVRNLKNLVGILRDCRDRFVKFDFYGRYVDSLVFDRSKLEAATDRILGDNNIRSQGSPDIMSIWNAGRTGN